MLKSPMLREKKRGQPVADPKTKPRRSRVCVSSRGIVVAHSPPRNEAEQAETGEHHCVRFRFWNEPTYIVVRVLQKAEVRTWTGVGTRSRVDKANRDRLPQVIERRIAGQGGPAGIG